MGCDTTTEYVKANVCTTCPAGSTCDGDAATVCPVAKYVDTNECKACPTGFTCDGTNAACDTTKYILANSCDACPAGKICDGTATTVGSIADATKANATNATIISSASGNGQISLVALSIPVAMVISKMC